MAKIPSALIDQIRNAVDIADVIGQDVQLKKQGKNLMGHCPFHQDNTPSFSVNQEKQFFYCFSCHRSGSVFSFLEQLHGLSFREAVEQVAKFANVDLPKEYTAAAATPQVSDEKRQLLTLHDQAAKLYHHVLVNTPAGQAALDYLLGRGMTRELIDQFDLGFAPDLGKDKQVLVDYLSEKTDQDYQLLRKSGLFVEHDDGQLHDRFRGRVMYPIKNEQGQVIAFSGRILTKKATANTPKYLNSPETSLFNKRLVLFNLDQAKKAARQDGHLTLFEGFMDVISAYGAGVQTGIASMGTSFTSEQVQVITRLTKELHIAYDGDEPGQAAIERSLKLVEQAAPNLAVKVIQLPGGLDPDEYIQQFGAIKFRDYLAKNEETPVDFRLAYLRGGLNLAKQSDLVTYLNSALQVLAGLESPLEQDVYVQKLAEEFHLDAASLTRQLAEIPKPTRVAPAPMAGDSPAPTADERQLPPPPPEEPAGYGPADYGEPGGNPAGYGPPGDYGAGAPGYSQPAAPQPESLSRGDLAAQLLLKAYCTDPAVRVRMVDFHFPTPAYEQLYTAIKAYFVDHDEFDVAQVMDQLPGPQTTLLAQVDKQLIDPEEEDQLVDDCMRVLTNELPLSEQIEAKNLALKEATMVGDADAIVNLSSELVQLYQRQQAMKTEEIN